MMDILILISLFAIVGIVNQIIRRHKCPNDRDLEDVFSGRIGNPRVKERIISHLGICEKCRDKVNDFNAK